MNAPNQIPSGGFYVTVGMMLPDAPSYVAQREDDQLYGALSSGDFA